MKTIQLVSILMMAILTISCDQKRDQITQISDYDPYIKSDSKTRKTEIVQELQFWNQKIKSDSLQITTLGPIAKAYTSLFDITGDIMYLIQAERALTKSVAVAAINKEKYLLSLASNYISQHRFKEAKKAAEAAFVLNPNTNAKMVLFDVSMELGAYQDAEKYLKQIANHSDYNFLIRLAKWNDYKGNLDATIRYMEKAKKIAESGKKEGLMLWSYTNLADYYGHAGRIQESYEHYLKALQIDPSNAYAKKGIAWIIYSYEDNPEEALRIMDVVTETYQSPDYFLFKSEIADYMDDEILKKANLEKYKNSVQNLLYGAMYNTYNAVLLAEEYQDFEPALNLAKQEVANRPTPLSYDLQAYVLFLKGEHQIALEIAEKFVANKTYEPEANYHLAQIYKANNEISKVAALKKELLESSYELGPSITEEVLKL